jgi:diaminohydroxyphosphoribosylaminopyrimidine deaminase / 5-amino-6-(5-phosphoribosylamino)uracil reductase
VTGTVGGFMDARFMALALSLGRRGMGQVWPNPAVGCVIVQGGRTVGRGWTQPGGRPHAEAMALAQAGDAARGATAYITLEPCAHQSPRGPACSDLLIAAGVARVVTAMTDPDPRTAGQGHARLAAAGIAVTTDCLEPEAAADHLGFLSRVLGGRVAVTLKLATTLDGRIATATGESRWITGPLARRDVHAERARHDAVIVGVGTALADDPDLTVRDLGIARQPVRIVIDSRLRLPVTARLGQSARQAPVWIVHTAAAPERARVAWAGVGARLIEVAADEAGHAEPLSTTIALAEAGLTRVFCEGGGTIAAALLAADCVDDILLYQAGRLFGGDGVAAVAPMGVTRLFQTPPAFRLIDTRRLGDDIRQHWRRRDLD